MPGQTFLEVLTMHCGQDGKNGSAKSILGATKGFPLIFLETFSLHEMDVNYFCSINKRWQTLEHSKKVGDFDGLPQQ